MNLVILVWIANKNVIVLMAAPVELLMASVSVLMVCDNSYIILKRFIYSNILFPIRFYGNPLFRNM